MSDSTNISRARRDLFELVDRVLDSDEVVYIRHRDRNDRVALVRESRLKYLEALRDPHPGHPGRMEGTARIVTDCTVEELVERVRASERDHTEARTADWSADE